MKPKSHYPLKGDIEYFCRPGEDGYSPSGVLRAMAMHVDGVTAEHRASVEAIMVWPNECGWSGTVLYQELSDLPFDIIHPVSVLPTG